MGDSGNAESTSPHLHFEIRQPAAAGRLHRHADQRLRVAPAGHGVERDLGLGAPPHGDRRRRPTSSFTYGVQTGDRGLLCDWDGDGVDEAVIYRAGTWYLRDGTSSGGTAGQIVFGTASDTPLCGDVDGDGARRAAALPRRHLDGPRRLRRRRRRRLDRCATASRPATSRCSATGTATATTTSAIHRGGTWHVRSTGTTLGGTVTTFRYGRAAGRPARRRRLGRRRRRRRRHLPQGRVAPPLDGAGASGATVTVLHASAPPSGQPLVGYGVRPVDAGHRHLPPAHRLSRRYRRSRSLAMWVIWISSVPA